jgi:hypothetical protein
MTDKIADATRRTRGYWFIGVSVLAAVFGLVVLVSGLVVRNYYLCSNPILQEETK